MEMAFPPNWQAGSFLPPDNEKGVPVVIPVPRCTVGRLMQVPGLTGVRRGGRCVATVADGLADKPRGLANRQFTAQRPNPLRVADITYVATRAGLVYVAFVIWRLFPPYRGFACTPKPANRHCLGCLGTSLMGAW